MQVQSGMDRARLALEGGGRIPAGSLPDHVADSWLRCRAADLDPRSMSQSLVLPYAEVKQLREALAPMRTLALAEMQVLYQQIAGSNFMIAFGDVNGIVLDTISDQQFADSTPGRVIIPGSMWNETERGTNALGLAARFREAVAVYGREHYFESHSQLSCMAAPIFDSAGNAVGLLDASCTNEARQQHTHALVKMSAAQIGNRLFFRERLESFILAFHPRAEFLDTLSAGLIAVDEDGGIIALNQSGKALLASLPASPGYHFSDLFQTHFSSALDGMARGGMFCLRDRVGSSVFMACRQIGRKTEGSPSAPASGAVVRTVEVEPGFVCTDPALKHAIRNLAAATQRRMSVHVTGETGTGKELLAEYVHRLSGRRGEFVAVNCGALPESLLISEIFGHEKGAYTNAKKEGAPGLARSADKGTLFLDEVSEIPFPAQAALLRFLDSMEVRPVGGNRTFRVDVQIVSATNRDLQEMVDKRQFRADLLHRLNGITIRLPPLRNRKDFALIVKHLLHKIEPDAVITDAAIGILAARSWPGNMRELTSELQRAAIEMTGKLIDESHFTLPPEVADDCCDECKAHPLSMLRCRNIRAKLREKNGNVSQTARHFKLSRTTVYKHAGDTLIQGAKNIP